MVIDKKTLRIIIISAAALIAVLSIVIAAVLIFGGREEPPAQEEHDTYSTLDDMDEFAGVWIASVFNIDFPSDADLSADALKAELDAIVDTVKNAELNTIFFQVRPEADALYESKIFPVSKYLSSNGELQLDALEYIIEAAHRQGIEVHAWVNPLRVSSTASVTLETLPENHPAKKNPEWVVEYADGKMYFNAGIPEVRELVCSGVEEIVENYDVDGMVFDDYFYPYPVFHASTSGSDEQITAIFDDAEEYAVYAEEGETLADWRRENINSLVKAVYETVKDEDKKCLFGVAPFGIWKNGYGDESGSLTSGNESYNTLYCDTVAWIKGEYVDYVAPQIYWTKAEKAAPYNAICDWWEQMVEGTKVRLLVSHAAYRYENDWADPSGIMTEQVTYARKKENYRGSIFYGYSEIKNNLEGICDEIKELYK